MPISKAPYKRTYQHTKSRGNEYHIPCDLCNGLYPRYKTFVIRRKFIINDPLILSNVDKNLISTNSVVLRVCPKCARFLGIVQPGKAVRKKLKK
jgi:small subunit ribosomal protein S26e